MTFDIILSGGTVVDGTGRPGRREDVGIAAGAITAIGSIPESAVARERRACTGMIVCPGFVDIHTHSDISLLDPQAGLNKLRQGVTTEVTGNCGFSPFPVEPPREQELVDLVSYLGPSPSALPWRSFDGYAAALERAMPMMNVACLVGHGALRVAVAGTEDHLAPTAQKVMAQLLDEALEQGAFGFSTGLTYVPSMFATADEISRLGEVAARHGALYATHARAQAGQELTAIEEAVAVGARSGVRVEFSHLAINTPRLWGTADASLELFDRANKTGVNVAFDIYPYDASASSIAQYLPTWLISQSEQDARADLARPSQRARALRDLSGGFYGGIPWMWDRVMLSEAGPVDAEHVGLTIQAIADALEADPCDAMLQLYERNGNSAQLVLFYRTEDDMVAFLRHPGSVIGSDGLAVRPGPDSSRPHPRYFGTFPRVLGRYVRDSPQLTLESAIRKMTGESADRLGLVDRGYVRRGYAADLVVFALDEVGDTATFVNPRSAPTGISSVLVNGTTVLDDGQWSGDRPGKVLRHQ